MKVLGIVGGAKKEGNTTRLVEEIILGAKDAGHETVTFKLPDLRIGHLEDKNGKIFFPNDDFEKIKPHLESMGALILGAPIWFSTVDSRTHTFIQRLYWYSNYHEEKNREKWPKGARAVNVITYGWDDPHAYDNVLNWLKDIEKGYGMKGIKNVVASGTGEKPVSENKMLLKNARKIGATL